MPEIGNQDNWGHPTVKHILKDLGMREEVQEMLPYGDIVTGTWKGTITTPGDLLGPFAGHTIVAGKQLKILFMRVWTQDPNGAKWEIVQTGGTSHGLPSGVRDYPFLEAAGAEVIGPVPLTSPIHVFEGSVGFYMQHGVASRYQHGIVWWGVEKAGDQD